jgi:hypothetical protein
MVITFLLYQMHLRKSIVTQGEENIKLQSQFHLDIKDICFILHILIMKLNFDSLKLSARTNEHVPRRPAWATQTSKLSWLLSETVPKRRRRKRN